MKKSLNSPPCLFGILAALALLIACIALPEELFGYQTLYLFGNIFVFACLLAAAGYFLWVAVRIVFGKNRT